jgi:hypothetical protein
MSSIDRFHELVVGDSTNGSRKSSIKSDGCAVDLSALNIDSSNIALNIDSSRRSSMDEFRRKHKMTRPQTVGSLPVSRRLSHDALSQEMLAARMAGARLSGGASPFKSGGQSDRRAHKLAEKDRRSNKKCRNE